MNVSVTQFGLSPNRIVPKLVLSLLMAACLSVSVAVRVTNLLRLPARFVTIGSLVTYLLAHRTCVPFAARTVCMADTQPLQFHAVTSATTFLIGVCCSHTSRVTAPTGAAAATRVLWNLNSLPYLSTSDEAVATVLSERIPLLPSVNSSEGWLTAS